MGGAHLPGGTQGMADKRDTFVRLATARTNAVIEKIRVLSNCSNPYAYEYTEDDVKRIFAAIDNELRIAKGKFSNHRKIKFKLE